MLQALLLLAFFLLVTAALVPAIVRIHPKIQPRHVYLLFGYHYLLTLVYYLYALSNPSDSKVYYAKVIRDYRGPDWSSFYGTSTTFIEFLGYPFIRFLGFSYESMMVLFSFFGFLGFLVYLIFLYEQLHFRPRIFGLDARLFVLFLPNFHFWSASFGKGSVIFLGIGLVIFSLSRLSSRWLWLGLGMALTYHVRPHIMFVLLASMAMGYILSGAKIPVAQKATVVLLACVGLFFVYEDVMQLTGLDEDFLLNSDSLTERAIDLQRATSGIDISQYSLIEKLLTFLYRPLFFDAPGALGVFVSAENVVYILLTAMLFRRGGWRFIWRADALIKTCLFAFLTVSVALAQISSNLGLAIRQKSQVMMLLLFIVLKFLDVQQGMVLRQHRERKKRLAMVKDLE